MLDDIKLPELKEKESYVELYWIIEQITRRSPPEVMRSKKEPCCLIRHMIRKKLKQKGLTLKQISEAEERVGGNRPHHSSIISSLNKTLDPLQRKHKFLTMKLKQKLSKL